MDDFLVSVRRRRRSVDEFVSDALELVQKRLIGFGSVGPERRRLVERADREVCRIDIAVPHPLIVCEQYFRSRRSDLRHVPHIPRRIDF
ncbi:hypothetical protein SDC9_204155 [bioreactor metagenome]|uniref:Uncharacterized protein n=1 Tax=bioreactor metagenome TaxID=1076179 RepID=A0A645IYE3_9ZZZZ